MSKSRNWQALSVPSIDGSKTELDVSGEVQSGIVPPRLTKRETEQIQISNVIALNISGIAGGQFTTVSYKEDITGQTQYDIVLIYNQDNQIEAAIRIEEAQS